MMRIEKEIEIDLAKIKTVEDLYSQLAILLGFFDGFGRNGDALNDCLFSMRYPEAELTKITISKSGYLVLILRNFESGNQQVKDTITSSVEFVNYKWEFEKGENPGILLLITHGKEGYA